MKKKIVGIAFCILLLMLVNPVGSSSGNSDVYIDLFAGTEGRNIGSGIGVWIDNQRNESVIVTLSCDQEYIFYKKHLNLNFTITIKPNQYDNGNFGVPGWGFKRIITSVQLDDETITREGIAFCNLVIFSRNIK